MNETHWHVERHSEDMDVFSGDLIDALDYAATELDLLAESEYLTISLYGEQGEFENAYRAFERSETWSNLAAHARNIVTQATASIGDRAPHYQVLGSDYEELIRVGASHAVNEINSKGPPYFVVWDCTDEPCEITQAFESEDN